MAAIPQTSKHVVEIETQYTGLVVRPGDKLVIATNQRPTMELADRMRQHLEGVLPGVELVIIPQATGLAVYRNEAEEQWRRPLDKPEGEGM